MVLRKSFVTHSLMPTTRNPSAAELMLDLLELTSLGSLTDRQLITRLRRSYPVARIARRAEQALSMLESEGLIEASVSDGTRHFRATAAGADALERRGRFPRAAAVLFTDIVDSTQLIETLGEDGAHACRQRHFTLLRETIERFDGRVVKNLGDGLMVLFADPIRALSCAGELQRVVAADPDGLGLRVGVHAGELLREGDDYFGTTVIVARRLCDGAASGRTLVSDAIRSFAAEAAEPAAIGSFVPLGRLALKGISRPVETFELEASLAPA